MNLGSCPAARILASIREVGDTAGHQHHCGEEVLVGEIVVLKCPPAGDEVRQGSNYVDELGKADDDAASGVWQDEKIFANGHDPTGPDESSYCLQGVTAVPGLRGEGRQVYRRHSDGRATGKCGHPMQFDERSVLHGRVQVLTT
ncbi:MAG: hypothetical protein ACYDGN_17480 [Acidimicrobiales bacterium]